MKKVLTLTLIAIMVLSTSVYAGRPWQEKPKCQKITNNYYEENNYNNQMGEADFPLYATLGIEYFITNSLYVFGDYSANTFDIKDFQGNHKAEVGFRYRFGPGLKGSVNE